MKKITVLLADDHGVVRQGLRVLVETEGDIEVVSEAKTGREAIDMTLQLHPNVVVMDIAMPLLNGVQATREILRIAPATKVLILSAHADLEYVEQVVLLGVLPVWLPARRRGFALDSQKAPPRTPRRR
jgi:DNA-binding NarL/FixJ family response regulator